MSPAPEAITVEIDHPFLFAMVDKTGAVPWPAKPPALLPFDITPGNRGSRSDDLGPYSPERSMLSFGLCDGSFLFLLRYSAPA
jgi:hypothetical protein